jgi:hypothetical protein
MLEIRNLTKQFGRLAVLQGVDLAVRPVVDPDCTLVTPMHKLACQLDEVGRGAARRGTCGMGIGEAARGRARGADVRVRDVLAGAPARERLAELARDSLAWIPRDPLPEQGRIIEYFRGRCDPEALYRRYREIPKIIDFGLAKVAAAVDAEPLTRTGQIVGTPEYMSPEQIEGKAVDARSDVYALGCLLYHLVAGRSRTVAQQEIGRG